MQNAIQDIVAYKGSLIDENNVFKKPVARILFDTESGNISDASDLFSGNWVKSEIYKKSLDANGNRERISCFVKVKGENRTSPVTQAQIEIYANEPILNDDIIGIRVSTGAGSSSTLHFSEDVSDDTRYEIKAESLDYSYVYTLEGVLVYGFLGEILEEGADVEPYKTGASISGDISVVSFTVRGETFTFNTAQLVLE